MYLTGLCGKNSIMDNALVPDQATDRSISLKPGSYIGDTNYRETQPSLLSHGVLGLLLRTEKKIGQ